MIAIHSQRSDTLNIIVFFASVQTIASSVRLIYIIVVRFVTQTLPSNQLISISEKITDTQWKIFCLIEIWVKKNRLDLHNCVCTYVVAHSLLIHFLISIFHGEYWMKYGIGNWTFTFYGEKIAVIRRCNSSAFECWTYLSRARKILSFLLISLFVTQQLTLSIIILGMIRFKVVSIIKMFLSKSHPHTHFRRLNSIIITSWQ